MILLTILKIIGICILAILAILLLVLLTLLFVPVRYRSVGKLDREDRQLMAKVSWLAHAVSAVAQYRDGKLFWRVSLFGIQILPKKQTEKKKQASRRSRNRQKSGGGEKTANPSENKPSESAGEGKNTIFQEKYKPTDEADFHGKKPEDEDHSQRRKPRDGNDHSGTKNARVKNTDENRGNNESTGEHDSADGAAAESTGEHVNTEGTAAESMGENDGADGTTAEKMGENESNDLFERFFRRIAHFFTRIRESFQSVRERLCHIRQRVDEFRTKRKQTKGKADRWKKFWHFDETQITLAMLKKEGKKLIRYLMPTRIRARIHFGFEDPADTGITLGLVSAVYGFFPKGIDLEPDFEEKVLEGEWKLKGRIRLSYFVRLAARLLLKRENRVTYRRLRKLL